MHDKLALGCRTPLAVGIAIALHMPVAGAQESQPQVTRIDEVMVTATRRSQAVQDVPYNISVVSSDLLIETGVSDASNLGRLVPGLSLVNEGPRVSGNRNTFSMRGMNVDALNNNDDNPGISQSTVSTYLGEVPVYFPLKLVDLQRVEVLRGPQGTLYGAGSSVAPSASSRTRRRATVSTSMSGASCLRPRRPTTCRTMPAYDQPAAVRDDGTACVGGS